IDEHRQPSSERRRLSCARTVDRRGRGRGGEASPIGSRMPKRWIFKSSPASFSISDLEHAPKKTTAWDGVRNYQARNFLRDEVKKGDLVLFYHSSAEETGIVGT